jgi:hypothetical protein
MERPDGGYVHMRRRKRDRAADLQDPLNGLVLRNREGMRTQGMRKSEK